VDENDVELVLAVETVLAMITLLVAFIMGH
jgi:hypothetical protein